MIIVAVLSLAQWGPIKDALDGLTQEIDWPGLNVVNADGEEPAPGHLQVQLGDHAAARCCSSPGLLTMLVLRVSPGRALRIYGQTLNQLKWATLTVATVLALAYVMNFSAQTLTLGQWIAGAGGVLAFLSSIIGWLGVAVTGSDTSSNSLFGALQVQAANEAGLEPDAARRRELLGRRARQDDLAAEPRDRRRRGRPRRAGGRAVPQGPGLEPGAPAGHVRARSAAIHCRSFRGWSSSRSPRRPHRRPGRPGGGRPRARPARARRRAARDLRRRVGLHAGAPAPHLRVRRAAAVPRDARGGRAPGHAPRRCSRSSRRARAPRCRGSRAAPAPASPAARCRSRTAC